MADEEIEPVLDALPELTAHHHIEVIAGLMRADLAPLAAALRAEVPFDDSLRHIIADAIEGKGPCVIGAKRSRAGRPEQSGRFQHDMFIWVCVREAKARVGLKRAVHEVSLRFARSESAVNKSRSRAQAELSSMQPDRQQKCIDLHSSMLAGKVGLGSLSKMGFV